MEANLVIRVLPVVRYAMTKKQRERGEGRAARQGRRKTHDVSVLTNAPEKHFRGTHASWRKRSCRIASLSALGTPTIRLVNPACRHRVISTGEAPSSGTRASQSDRVGGARTGVDVDALPASDGVYAHDGVHALYGLAAHSVTRRTGAVSLRDRGVDRGEAVEVLLEARAEGRVERVAA